MSMKDFLAKEGCTGGLRGILPPNNDSSLWGQRLWKYLEKYSIQFLSLDQIYEFVSVADAQPAMTGKFIAFPDRPGDFNLTEQHHPKFRQRLKAFRGQGFNDRKAVYYDEVILFLKENQCNHVEINLESSSSTSHPHSCGG